MKCTSMSYAPDVLVSLVTINYIYKLKWWANVLYFRFWFIYVCMYMFARVLFTFFVFICLCIVVSNTYCVVFLFCLSSLCVPYVVSFSGLSICIASSVFSNVYLLGVSIFPLFLRFFLSDFGTVPYNGFHFIASIVRQKLFVRRLYMLNIMPDSSGALLFMQISRLLYYCTIHTRMYCIKIYCNKIGIAINLVIQFFISCLSQLGLRQS
jgi:hypothetical protein